jgi:hypothetical protein
MPKINTPLKLDKFYQLDLKETRKQLAEIDTSVINPQMNMRRFFQNLNWDQAIHSVDISTGGIKGGVLFLYEKDNQDNAKPQPSYVVKLTNAPQQTLFAEYVLKHIGQAKIPKSLVVELEWKGFSENPPTTDGMKLVHIILNKPHSTITNQNKTKQTRYNKVKKLLDAGNEQKPSFIIIMKYFGEGFPFSESPYELNEWFKNNNLNVNNTAFVNLTALQKQDSVFLEIVKGINRNKEFLSDLITMKNLGRVLAADTILGNFDRFEQMNLGNSFFIAKNNKKRVGVIDNDAWLPVYNSNNMHREIQKEYKGETPQDQYLKWVLELGYELEPIDPAASGVLSRLRKLLGDFDNYYFYSQQPNKSNSIFFQSFRLSELPLLKELYNDDGMLLENSANKYPKFSDNPTSQEWQQVKQWIKTGFVEGLANIKLMNLDEYRSVYTHLASLYGFDGNFDFTAFEVRYLYMLEAELDIPNGTFIFPSHDTVVLDIKNNYLNHRYPIISEIQAALDFGVQQELINTNERYKILSYVSQLTESQQQSIIPKVTGIEKATYEPRVKAVQCAVLQKFTIDVEFYLDKGGEVNYPSTYAITQACENSKSTVVKKLESSKFYKKTRGWGIRPNIEGDYEVNYIATSAGMDLSTY